jgi:hypothetical protein
MKIVLISFFLISFTSAIAHVPTKKDNSYSAKLNKFKFDSSYDLSLILSQYTSGFVRLNKTKKIVELIVSAPAVCPPNEVCAQALSVLINVEDLPIVSVTKGNCNEIVTTAKEDLRPSDGALTTITITDNSANTCEYSVADQKTTVVYNIQGYSRFSSKTYNRTVLMSSSSDLIRD